jgi:hypothetical protein
MMFHVAVEALMGLIPFFGNIFDAFWKANVRNRILLEQSILNPHRGRRDKLVILCLLGLCVGLFLAFLWGTFWVAQTIYVWISSL